MSDISFYSLHLFELSILILLLLFLSLCSNLKNLWKVMDAFSLPCLTPELLKSLHKKLSIILRMIAIISFLRYNIEVS